MQYVKDFIYIIKYIFHLKPGILIIYPIKIIINSIKPIILLIFPKLLLDEIASGCDFNRIIILAVMMVVVTFFMNSIYNVLQNIWSHYYNILSALIGYEHLNSNLNCKFKYIEDSKYLNLQQRVRDSIMPTDYLYFISSVIENIIQIITYSYIIFVFDFKLFIGIIIYSTISYIIGTRVNKEEYQFGEAVSPISRVINYFYNLASNPVYGKDVRVNGLSGLIKGRIEEAVNRKVSVSKKYYNKKFRFDILLLICSFIWEGCLYYVVVISALTGTITIGSFTLYLGVLSNFVGQVSGLLKELDKFNYWSKLIENLYQYKTLSQEKDIGNLTTSGLDRVDIEFKNVWFKYPNKDDYILKDINIKINAGEKLAIVGMNGAGKSTFIKLLCRLYEPTKGEILVNGENISSYDSAEYSNLLTVVLQDFKLFAFSVSDNIVLQKDYNQDKFNSALEKANIKDRLQKLKDKEKTYISKEFDDNGVDFSGGERQKIAIARAIYRNSKIFILDEPNSAMDPISESKFYENFRNITEQKTTIYISHRLASAKFCDNIAVFNDGQITEYGSHESLIELKGLYSDLFNKQASGYIYGVDQ